MEKKTVPPFACNKPCDNCPYRTDAPLKLWHKEEYEKLLRYEKSEMGTIYQCHKDNGSVCIGWLMKQKEQNFPSMYLRMSLIKNKISPEYLDSLSSPSPLYENVRAMIKANYRSILERKPFKK